MGINLPAMLPSPTLCFTIPSVQDDLVLHCRLYHPTCLSPTSVSHISTWRKKAAIVAHPYAPLGGSYDDPVVDMVAATLLSQGFVVGTFNFRGAGNSKGRTSWQSKPEQNDYISFVGFMILYMHILCPPQMPKASSKLGTAEPELHDLSPVQSQVLPPHRTNENSSPAAREPSTLASGSTHAKGAETRSRLLLAGYSYGALVTTCLPPIISSIIEPFQTPVDGSAYAEIRLRAEFLASQQNQLFKSHMDSLLQNCQPHKRGRSLKIHEPLVNQKIRNTSGSVRVGGDEDLRRASYDSYRPRNSFGIDTPERVRKSVDRVRSIARSHPFSPKRQPSCGSVSSSRAEKNNSEPSKEYNLVESAKTEANKSMKEIPDILDGVRPAYLLISPLQGFVNSLATMWSSKSTRWKDSGHDKKLTIDPTLALYGDDDVFVSVKRLRSWAERLSGEGNVHNISHFRYQEVSGAGHFWHDGEAIRILRDEIKNFASEL